MKDDKFKALVLGWLTLQSQIMYATSEIPSGFDSVVKKALDDLTDNTTEYIAKTEDKWN